MASIIDHFNVSIAFKSEQQISKGILVIRTKSKPAIEGGFIHLDYLGDDGVYCQKGYALDQIAEYSISVILEK